MKKLDSVLASAVLDFHAFTVSAVSTPEDVSNIRTAEIPQQMNQSQAANKMNNQSIGITTGNTTINSNDATDGTKY
ncbi:MAG TPA: hypothetical protein VK974_04565 [Methylophilaceae bacterium]|nr:hypothetical protein [Methylophilaceae bacterium]